jgi:hypothetical protein
LEISKQKQHNFLSDRTYYGPLEPKLQSKKDDQEQLLEMILVGGPRLGEVPVTSADAIAPRWRTVKAVVNPVFAQFKTVLLCCFLAVKDRTLDALDFYNRTEATWTKDSSLRVPLESSCKGRYG